MLKIGVLGAAGRMGRALLEVVINHPEAALGSAWEVRSAGLKGVVAGSLVSLSSNVLVTDDLDEAFEDSDVLIDFTRPEGTMSFLPRALDKKRGMVIGTTGFDGEQLRKLKEASRSIPIVHAPNFSVGVNVLLDLLRRTTRALGPDYDVEIVETHHRHKVDAPSGTALAMGGAVADARGRSLEELAVYQRVGHTGERKPGSIGFATIRAGDVVGDHVAIFAVDGERVELGHKASSRGTFARGAVRSALWLAGKTDGLYDMSDVLGIR